MQITEFTVFLTKNRPIRQQNVPYLGPLSNRLTRIFGVQIFGVQKAPGGGKNAINIIGGAKKKCRPFFFFFDTKAKKSAGALNGNVTPLPSVNN